MRSNRPVRMSLILALLVGLSAAKPALAQSSKVVTVGASPVSLTIPAGFCELDPAQARDAQLINLVTKLLAGHNQLLLYLGDCQQLADWREDKRTTLDQSIQIQIADNLRDLDFSTDPKRDSVVPSVCAEARKQAPADVNSIADAVKSRLRDLSKTLKINDIQLIGVVGEDAGACYVAMLQKVENVGAGESTVAIMYVTAMIGGRLLFVYHYGLGNDTGAFERLQQAAEAHVASLRAANP